MTFRVLPVPVSPTHSTCLSFRNSASMMYVYRTVSAVGTMISANAWSGLGAYSYGLHPLDPPALGLVVAKLEDGAVRAAGGRCGGHVLRERVRLRLLAEERLQTRSPGPVTDAPRDQMRENTQSGSAARCRVFDLRFVQGRLAQRLVALVPLQQRGHHVERARDQAVVHGGDRLFQLLPDEEQDAVQPGDDARRSRGTYRRAAGTVSGRTAGSSSSSGVKPIDVGSM